MLPSLLVTLALSPGLLVPRHALGPALPRMRTPALPAKCAAGAVRTAAFTMADEAAVPPPKPTLAGEKLGATILTIGAALVVGYTLGATGSTPASLWAMPGAVVRSPVMQKAAKKAIGGGLSGALAGVIQVLALMWLRTTMNYQYRNGGSTGNAMRTLYKEGGLPRFYQGVQFAIFQTPLSRFGDTAANTGVLELFAMTAWGGALPLGLKTAAASATGSLWRIAITPLDTLKTTLQVEGAGAYNQVVEKVKREGPTVLYQGALANALASFVGSYPWFFTFNLAMRYLPAAPEGVLLWKLVRSAAGGVIASFVSDVFSNVIRVLKTTRQTSATTIGYREAAAQIIEKEGVVGLFTRGLGTRVLTNALQASMFTVVWKYLEGRMN